MTPKTTLCIKWPWLGNFKGQFWMQFFTQLQTSFKRGIRISCNSVYRKDLFRSLSFCFVKILWRIQIVPLHINRESMAGSVIQATGMVEFEDGLWTRVLFGSCWCLCGCCTYPRINPKPTWGCGLPVGPRLSVVVIRSLFSDQILILPSSAHGWY